MGNGSVNGMITVDGRCACRQRICGRLFQRLSLSILLLLGLTAVANADQTDQGAAKSAPQSAIALPIYTYTLSHDGTAESYDESLAVACLQGIINRDAPMVHVLSKRNARPQYWLDILSKQGRWLAGRAVRPLSDLNALVKLAGKRVKGAVIWDPAVPATINVATTIAGVEDGVALSPSYADRYLKAWQLPVLHDLRGRFTGAETGSKKNDAYRWAIREYLAKDRCSSHLLCLYEDAFTTRARGDIGYVLTRDWAVKNRSFVFDLSPWGDEKPGDDPKQRLGLDLETYKFILSEIQRAAAGNHLTEMTGFFVFSKYANVPGHKSSHEPVPTEWETVYLITPYNAYQNTASSDCFNQSLHSHAKRLPLRQNRTSQKRPIENKTYLCILMADYDSATPLYDFLPKFWDDPNRGKTPFVWGINPNLLETYPDLIAYFYDTMGPADTIEADASAAGYFNPSRVRPESWPLFIKHNQAFFREADQTIAPMVLDWSWPSDVVKEAFQQFAPNGYGTIVADMHTNTGAPILSQVWKGMPMIELINDANEFPGVEKTADIVARAIQTRGHRKPGFYFVRIVWTSPTQVRDMLETLRKQHPELDLEVLDVHTFFGMFKDVYDQAPKISVKK